MKHNNALLTILLLLLLVGCTPSTPKVTITTIPSATQTLEPTATTMPTAIPTPTLFPTADYRVTNPENDHQYLLSDFLASWHKASEYCVSLGGHLATIQSAAENQFVSRMANEMWLGATDEVKEGDWLWVTGERWSYTNWHPDEPTNCCPAQSCGPQDCTPESYLNVDRTGQWNDVSDGQMFFVCEWDEP